MNVMVDAPNYKRMQKPAASQRRPTGGTSRQPAAPKESYAACRRRFFIEADATLRGINAELAAVEHKPTGPHATNCSVGERVCLC